MNVSAKPAAKEEAVDDDLFSLASGAGSTPAGTAGGAVSDNFDFAAYINANSKSSGGLFDS
jgi:hypothetical protein